MDQPVIQPSPAAQAAPQPAPAPPDGPEQPQPPAAAQEAAPELPPELLEIPALQGLLSGAPAAVSMDISNFAKTDEGKLIAQNGQALQSAGLGFYKSMHGDTGAIFNQLHLHPADLQAADKAGKLTSVAPPWTKVNHALSSAGAAHPALMRGAAPSGMPMAQPPPPPQSATGAVQPPGKPLPAGAQNKLLQARIAAASAPPPTGGPAPGASQLLNRVLKPVL